MASVAKSSPLRSRLCSVWIFFFASASFEALLFCRCSACCAAGCVGHDDLRQVILRLNQVELRLVRVVVARDLGVGDVDLRLDLLVQQLGPWSAGGADRA